MAIYFHAHISDGTFVLFDDETFIPLIQKIIKKMFSVGYNEVIFPEKKFTDEINEIDIMSTSIIFGNSFQISLHLSIEDAKISYSKFSSEMIYYEPSKLEKTENWENMLELEKEFELEKQLFRIIHTNYNLEIVNARNYPIHIRHILMKEKPSCSVCLEDLSLETMFVTKCGHFLCFECEFKIGKTTTKCPICRNEF